MAEMISFLNAHGCVTTVSKEDWEERFASDVGNKKLTAKQVEEYGKLGRAVSEAEAARRSAVEPKDIEATSKALAAARAAFAKFVDGLRPKD